MRHDVAYTIDGYAGVAWSYRGPETTPDEDTEWSGIEEPTGNVFMVMVGDDRTFVIDPSDCHELPDDDYCSGCGQTGCGWDR